MNLKKSLRILILVLIFLTIITGAALADDGRTFKRNVSETPDAETSQSIIIMMDFYVPAQDHKGNLKAIPDYLLADGVTVAYPTRNYAKPLVTVYNDDIGHLAESASGSSIQGAMSYGAFDAFAAVSLDDGNTWQKTNLSNSATLSSIIIDGEPYPGDVNHVVHAVFGDKIFVAWASRYCADGYPLYKAINSNPEWLTNLTDNYGKDVMYLYDLFGVNGSQGEINYEELGFPEVGTVPFNCIWTARGQIIPGDLTNTTPLEGSHILWTQPERLTSGVRDANLPAVDCAMGAGCILTWQEDPEGLRPGLGLGPGEGWSGAIANQQTDIWYSYISDADFDLVFANPDRSDFSTATLDTALTDAYDLSPNNLNSFVPMAMPVRLTDNAMCKATGDDPYCYINFSDGVTLDELDDTRSSDSTLCYDTMMWDSPNSDQQVEVCVAQDERFMVGRVASTRVRMNLKPYTPVDAVDSDGDGTLDISAWVVMAAEESKALGYTGDDDTDPIDIGKDIWYYSFDMFDHVFADQGGILNQPSSDPLTGEMFEVEVDEITGYEFYQTEIARRFSLATNSVISTTESESGLSAMLLFKQGIINQGGPADIFARRVLIDQENFDPALDNPYAYENMECVEWDYADGLNPNYLKGICLDPAINLSGSTVVACDGDCSPQAFPWDGGEAYPKLLEWRQCDGLTSISGCTTDSDLDDQSWDNPVDVAKGHRGFIDGDIVMILYAWSPNWKANSVGNDHYNLYVRRSFNGGATWTTTPAALGGDGTEAIEFYRTDGGATEATLFTYGAGEFEQGRDVSLLTSNRVTILDPRYTPTGGLKMYPEIRVVEEFTTLGLGDEALLPYVDIGDNARDRSKYFLIYETGDNTTVEAGEAVPMDLFYSRAYNYGDDYEWWDNPNQEEDYFTDWWAHEDDEDVLSGEASVVCTPGGLFAYVVWNQWQENIYFDDYGNEVEEIYNSDQIFQRLLYLPDDTEIQTMPFASVYYQSDKTVLYKDGATITLGGFARDFDKLGDQEIVAYEWSSNLDGVLSNSQVVNILVNNLSLGMHSMTFRAQDAEGFWSPPARTWLLVGDQSFVSGLPIMVK